MQNGGTLGAHRDIVDRRFDRCGGERHYRTAGEKVIDVAGMGDRRLADDAPDRLGPGGSASGVDVVGQNRSDLAAERKDEPHDLAVDQPAADHAERRDLTRRMKLVARQGRAGRRALGADDGAFHERLRPSGLHRVEHHHGRGTADAERKILGERRDPFDARDALVAAEIAGQGDDALAFHIGEANEHRMGQAAVALAVDDVSLADEVDDLVLLAAEEGRDVRPAQRENGVVRRHFANPLKRRHVRAV